MSIETKKPRHNETVEKAFREFKEHAGFTHSVGVIGGAEDEVIDYSKEILRAGLSKVKNDGNKLAVVSGGTKGGVPEMALDVGRSLNMPTIGIYPLEGQKYAAQDKLDFGIGVPSPALTDVKWGIETPTLVSIPDVFILIGGEWGSLTEVATIMKRNRSLVKNGKDPKPVLALKGSGNVADSIIDIVNRLDGDDGSCYMIDSSGELAEIVGKNISK